MAIWGDGQKLCRLLIEVFATPATICDKTLTRQQNHVAKHPRLQHPGLKPKHVERLYAIAGFNAEELTPKYPDFIKDLVLALYDAVFPAEEAVAQYRGLWVVERAFRVGKGTLEMRPMFHFTERRIEAHVCICFLAYKVYKELERIITCLDIKLSVDKVLDIAKTITTLRVHMPNNRSFYTKTMFLTDDHKAIRPLFEVELGKI